jgi:hypothetical protein
MSAQQQRRVSRRQLQEQRERLWLLIDGRVYDLTAFQVGPAFLSIVIPRAVLCECSMPALLHRMSIPAAQSCSLTWLYDAVSAA